MTGEIGNLDELLEYHLTCSHLTDYGPDYIYNLKMSHILFNYIKSNTDYSEWSYYLQCVKFDIEPCFYIKYKYEPVYTDYLLTDDPWLKTKGCKHIN
jgi:hypothetical protein